MKTKIQLLLLAAVFSGLMAAAFPVFSQYGQNTRKTELEVGYENAEKIDHSVYGIMILSKDRWKTWILRSTMIISIFIAALIIFFSIPKNNEINIVISYGITGSLFILSFWTTLAGWMLMRLNRKLIGTAFVACSAVMYAVFYLCVIKTKKSDISFATLKESFQKLANDTREDGRLVSVSGQPGDWVEDDFSK